jgi:hypothetical protein
MEVQTEKSLADPYIHIKNMNFFSGLVSKDAKIANATQGAADEQLKILMKHMPEKVTFSPHVSTSVYSNPILNTYVARLAKDAGRVTVEAAGTKQLNPILKAGSGAADELDQILTQFPKVQKSIKLLNEKTGKNLFEPYMEFQGKKIDPSYLKSDEFKQLRETMKYENPDADILHQINILVPKYKMTKHWKNGGWLDKYK